MSKTINLRKEGYGRKTLKEFIEESSVAELEGSKGRAESERDEDRKEVRDKK